MDGVLTTTRSPVSLVDGEVDVAARAALDLAHDLVALEFGARFEQRRARQFGELAEYLVGFRVGQFVDADELDGQVVARCRAAGPPRRWRGPPRRDRRRSPDRRLR